MIPGGLKFSVVLANLLYVVDTTPGLRFLLKARIWAPLVLGLMLYYRHSVSGACTDTTLLSLVMNALTPPTCLQLPHWVQTLLPDLVGLIVIKEILKFMLCSLRFGREALQQEAPTKSDISRSLTAAFMNVASNLPVLSGLVQGQIDSEIKKMESNLVAQLRPEDRDACPRMPEKGMPAKELIHMMRTVGKKEDKKWQEGMVSGAVYHGKAEHLELMNAAYAAFSVSNPLHADIWPSSMKFEAEIVRWVADLVRGGDEGVCGAVTSGGTESIILAVKSHRDRAKKEYGITNPEIIACVNAHAALDKACDLMNIRLVKIPMDKKYTLSPRAVASCITSDTIMVYSSAPAFPQGVVDPISELAKLCKKKGVGLHVDCCLGGFILPFAQQMKEFDVPSFDFGNDGVTSMSVDTHKFGYASKGTSVVVYRNKTLRKYQYFAYPEWPGGLYVTPTIAGSRPGALTAAAWAAMASIGVKGYKENTKAILQCAQKIAKGVKKIDGLYLLDEPKTMIVCFGSKEFNPLRVADVMAQTNGWSLNSLQHPNSVHICCTIQTVGREDKFLTDLRDAVKSVRASQSDKPGEDSTAAIYGLAGDMPAGPVKELMYVYTDVKLTV